MLSWHVVRGKGMARRKPTEWEVVMGQRIRELRRARGLTQQQLAHLVDVTVTAVSMWETGVRTPYLETASRLADVLGCTIDDIAGRKPAKKRGRP
jgi:transcriptional regulator with XRE-family HTH domain